MPVILENTSIRKINDTFPDPGVEIETFKTSSIMDGDTVVNVPTMAEINESYVNQLQPITEYTVLDADATNLIAWYKFDGNANDMLLDSSGNNHTLINPSGTTPEYDSSIKVVGDGSLKLTNDYVEMPLSLHPYNIWNGNGMSFSLWFKMPTSNPSSARIFTFGDNDQSTNPYNMLRISRNGTNNNLIFTVKINTSTNYTTTNDYVDDNWHHLVWSIDTSGVWSIYIDNLYINPGITKAPNNFNHTKRYIGRSGFPSDTTYSTLNLDDFRIYNKVLTPMEIDALANLKIRFNIEPQSLTHYTEERMYPPTRDLTSASHVISGQPYGNGVYVTNQSTIYNGLAGYTAFNTSSTTGYHGAAGQYSGGNYVGSNQDIETGYKGDYITIELPYAITLTRYGFKQRPGSFEAKAPGKYKIYGSNGGLNWTVLVHKTSKITYNLQKSESNDYYEENVDINQPYQHFALVVNELSGGSNVLNFDEWYIYGKEYLYDEPDYKVLTFTYDDTRYPKIDADDSNLVAWYKFDDSSEVGKDTQGNYDLTNSSVSTVNDFLELSADFDSSSSTFLYRNNANIPWNNWKANQ